MCGKNMLQSLYLSVLLISCFSFDFGSANSSEEAIEGNGWEILAKTELTCKGKAITKKGITEKKCKEFAEKKNRNFVWYTPKIGKFQDPELCALYKSCDLKKGGRMPSRPGKTLERNSSGKWNVIATTTGTCAGKQVFRKTGPQGVSFEKCIELMNNNKDANFVWFNDITMKKKKANCAGYKKCDLKKRVALGRTGVTIKKITTSDADNA